uniref:Protein fantom n=1 Tax=Schistocephalus solidus TaxID=70667 RepID=A0A0X3NXV7_SCHSO
MVEESKRLGTWTRDQLEDYYLRAYNENIQLKKLSREQEDKMKRMATKILRMASDKKLLNGTNVGGPATEDYEEKLITQQKKISDLTNKVQLLQNQMNATNIKIGNPAPARVPQTNMSNSRRSRENVSTVVNDNISHQTYIQTQETIRDFQMQRASLEQLLRQTCEQNNINEQKVFDLQRKLDEQERVFQEQLQQSKLEMATKQRRIWN